MILYYNNPDIELDDWHKVVVRKFETPHGIVFNCDELIPFGVNLYGESETPLYSVGESKHYPDKNFYRHKVIEIPTFTIPVKPLFKSKLAEKFEAIETELENDVPEYLETFDEQIESDLKLYGAAYFTTDKHGIQERIDPLTITVMTRSKGNG